METRITSKHFIFFLSILMIYILTSCTGDITKVDNDGSMKISGVVRNKDGMPAKHVSVQLFPSDFNPYTDLIIDSTMSDSSGSFSFSLSSSGLYNLYVNSPQGYGFDGQILISENESTIEREFVLREPGSVSGTVNLRHGDNNKEVIILVLGTNTYAMPDDSTGTFSIPALAEGVYRIRLLSMIKEYGIYECSVTVIAGKNTEISEIITLSYGVPDIKEVKAAYDKYFMRVSLSWNIIDTSNVREIHIYRNTSVAGIPFAIISNTCTTFTDNVFNPDPEYDKNNNVLRYTIAACGRNGSLGRSFTVPDIQRRGVFLPEDSVDLKSAGIKDLHPFDNQITVDGNRNIYISGINWITKIDPSGTVCAEYVIPDFKFDNDFYFKPVSDLNGNVYYLKGDSLIKLSSALSFSRACRTNSDKNSYIKVDKNGNIYNFAPTIIASPEPINSTRLTYSISVFDSTLSPLDSSVFLLSENADMQYQYHFQDILNGKIAFFGATQKSSWDYFTTENIHTNEVQSRNIKELLKNVDSLPLVTLERVCQLKDGITIISALVNFNIFTRIYLVLDTSGVLIGMFSLPCWDINFLDCEFDGVGRLYCYNRDTQIIYISKLDR